MSRRLHPRALVQKISHFAFILFPAPAARAPGRNIIAIKATYWLAW